MFPIPDAVSGSGGMGEVRMCTSTFEISYSQGLVQMEERQLPLLYSLCQWCDGKGMWYFKKQEREKIPRDRCCMWRQSSDREALPQKKRLQVCCMNWHVWGVWSWHRKPEPFQPKSTSGLLNSVSIGIETTLSNGQNRATVGTFYRWVRSTLGAFHGFVWISLNIVVQALVRGNGCSENSNNTLKPTSLGWSEPPTSCGSDHDEKLSRGLSLQ